MRTKNPAEEFGVAQYSDGRTGWEPARRPGRAGGRGFNGAVPVRPATSAGHPVPPGTSSCRPPGATAAGATLMYLHDTQHHRWSPQHKAILFTRAATTWRLLRTPLPACQGFNTWRQKCFQDPMKTFWKNPILKIGTIWAICQHFQNEEMF